MNICWIWLEYNFENPEGLYGKTEWNSLFKHLWWFVSFFSWNKWTPSSTGRIANIMRIYIFLFFWIIGAQYFWILYALYLYNETKKNLEPKQISQRDIFKFKEESNNWRNQRWLLAFRIRPDNISWFIVKYENIYILFWTYFEIISKILNYHKYQNKMA